MRWPVATLVFVISLVPVGVRAQSTVHPYIGAPEDRMLVEGVLDGWFSTGGPTQIVYVAPPDGSGDGAGTQADPRRDLIDAVGEATAGTAIYLAPGVYSMSDIRDQFGHPSSVLRTRASGTRGTPIIVSTDPALYDPGAGQVAVLDFDYDNQQPNVRTMSVDLGDDYWLLERLEIRRMAGRGIWLSGHNNVIRDNYIHHVNTPGSNNDGLIMISASGGPTNNVIMGNHFAYAGELDIATDAFLSAPGVNGGCIYTETRQSYDSTLPDRATSSLQELLDALLPADSHVYLYNNYAHHCAYAYGTKNSSEGPYFFLSNVAHDVHIGVRNVFSDSLIRNNIFFAGAGDVAFSAGISNGGNPASFWKEILNGQGSEISHNTIVGAQSGVSLRSGWSVHSHDNLVLAVEEGLHVQRTQYEWYDAGAWPGIRGEWLLGDLGPSHPYYAIMPPYLQDAVGTFVRFRAVDNCYDAEPTIAPADFVQPANDVTGMVADEDHVLIAATEVDLLFVDTDSYVRDFANAATCGSRVTIEGALPPPDPDPEPEDPDAPADPDSASGCGCQVRPDATGAASLLLVLAAIAVVTRRRRDDQVRRRRAL